MKRSLYLAVGMAFGAALASAGTVSYTCDTTINATPAGTCAYLNSTTAGLYSSTFSNANASIYIKMGITGLGSSTVGSYNDLSYSTYLSDLTATASADTVDVHALTALNSKDTAVYGTGIVVITSALGEALGVPNSSLAGTTASGVSCTIGTGGCYNGIITITTPANLFTDTGQFLYWDQTGGIIGANAYDFYSIVEHETDEILGTSSCISTQGLSLTNPCNFLGVGTPSAVDLFRYSATTGTLLPDSSLSTTSGAYFSYNGGLTNGVPDGAVYNTLANGNDYADFAAYCQNVQDATGCLGSIQNISGGEINILDAVGYNLNSGPETPEPGTMALFGAGFAALAVYRRRRRA